MEATLLFPPARRRRWKSSLARTSLETSPGQTFCISAEKLHQRWSKLVKLLVNLLFFMRRPLLARSQGG